MKSLAVIGPKLYLNFSPTRMTVAVGKLHGNDTGEPVIGVNVVMPVTDPAHPSPLLAPVADMSYEPSARGVNTMGPSKVSAAVGCRVNWKSATMLAVSVTLRVTAV